MMEKIKKDVLPSPGYFYWVYKSIDGKEFNSEEQCLEYEKRLDQSNKFKLIRQECFYDLDTYDVSDGCWYLCKTKEEIQTVINQYDPKMNHSYGIENLKVNEWFMVRADYGGDYPDRYYFITLKEVQVSYNSFLKKLWSYNG